MFKKSFVSILLVQLFTATIADLPTLGTVVSVDEKRSLLPRDVRVNKKINYTKQIKVRFINPNTPLRGDFIGIYPDPGKGVPMTSPLDTPLFWLYNCKSQTCPDDYTPKERGVIKFNVKDPVSEDLQQWPLPSGNYRTCLGTYVDEEDEDILIGKCRPFKVKPVPAKAINNLQLTNGKEVYSNGESITATFSTTNPILNSWVGIYKYIDNPPTMSFPEPMLWVYLGCNNQGGNQNESNNCSVKKKDGSIIINETSQDRSLESWPIDDGKYQLCIVLDNNTPYNNFKCFSSFEVKSLSS